MKTTCKETATTEVKKLGTSEQGEILKSAKYSQLPTLLNM